LVVDDTIGTALYFATLYKQKPRNLAIVANNLYSAQSIYEFLLSFIPEKSLAFFPADELLRAEVVSSSRELLSQRVYALSQLLERGPKILITHPAALLRYLPPKESFKSLKVDIKVGDHVDIKELREKLLETGYSRVNKIDHSLQFASRGDVFDVFSVNYLKPIRIELFDDEVESIRYFDIATQASAEPLKSVSILPATDIFLTDDKLNSFAIRFKDELDKECASLAPSNADTLREYAMHDLEDYVGKNYRQALYKYYAFALGETHSVLSYFDPELVFVASKERFLESSENLVGEANQYLGELSRTYATLKVTKEYMTPKEAFSGVKNVAYGSKFLKDPDDPQFNVRPIISNGNGLAAIIPTIRSYLSTDEKVVAALAEPHQRETVMNLLKEAGIPYEIVDGFSLPEKEKLGVSDASLNVGFEAKDAGIAYLSPAELFARKAATSRFTSRFRDGTILKSYEDLKPGDYVVHEYNGIGQFLGVKTLETDGIHRDYLHIAYAGKSSLYVPLEQFRLVRKYSGREGVAPRLSHLSSKEWERRKAHIEERVDDFAERLLKLYGTRARIRGFAFPKDDELQKRFEDEFPYTLTPDQERAVDDIKADMEKPECMDRLLIGDVGFGKTEVAFRACFKCILAGKQAAILCPTTLLARQHYSVAEERFASFGVHVAVLSRLVGDAEAKKTIEDLAAGKIDLIIGTHRLLGKDVVFKDLGLLVVDEEQRFGVEQKEKIKEIKNSVDVLTLSATPIPRTLQMSLVGIRPLSEIRTPPESRMPIQTYVTPFKASVAYELIARELGRDGQVFYVHNRVDTIYRTAEIISENVPRAKIGVVHGKMERDEIEDVMSEFYDGRLNVLVCTSIIENGIDIPNANMLLVEDADRFGLSQLYQIKGRVGRGNRIAYAYLFYKPNKNMNEDAEKRLAAIQDFTELGSGYKIAERDLLIRGAGDILGEEQAGFIDSIGLDLYLKMLNEAIQEKKTGVKKEAPKPVKVFGIDAYIPKDYAVNSDKIELYQEIENCKSETELEAVKKHMRDVYGPLPKETELLIDKKKVDLVGQNPEFQDIEEMEGSVRIHMGDGFSRVDGIGIELFNALTPYLKAIRASFVEKRIMIEMRKEGEWVKTLHSILLAIHEVWLRHAS
jgi:transcription-repair coupling factor (superfamily II helicase)